MWVFSAYGFLESCKRIRMYFYVVESYNVGQYHIFQVEKIDKNNFNFLCKRACYLAIRHVEEHNLLYGESSFPEDMIVIVQIVHYELYLTVLPSITVIITSSCALWRV